MVDCVLETPGVLRWVVQESWGVVAFVEELENTGEDLWFPGVVSGFSRWEDTYSSGRLTLFVPSARNWSPIAPQKKGERERTSSWAAKTRCSGPTIKVIIGLVRRLSRYQFDSYF